MATVTLQQIWASVPYTPSGAKSKGDVVVVNDRIGVVVKDIAAGVAGELAVSFLGTFPKASGSSTAIADGKKVYWDASGVVVSEDVTLGLHLGVTIAASVDGDTTQAVIVDQAGGIKQAATVAALTDSTTGTAGATLAAGVGVQTLTIPLTSLATGLSTSAIDLLTDYVPGYRFKVLSFDFVTTVAGTGSGASQTFNLEIGSTNLTGGSLNVTLASTDTIGKKTLGSSVTAANVGTSTDTLSIEMAASGTVFTAGAGYFVIKIQNMDTADAVASLAAKTAALLTALKNAGVQASA